MFAVLFGRAIGQLRLVEQYNRTEARLAVLAEQTAAAEQGFRAKFGEDWETFGGEIKQMIMDDHLNSVSDARDEAVRAILDGKQDQCKWSTATGSHLTTNEFELRVAMCEEASAIAALAPAALVYRANKRFMRAIDAVRPILSGVEQPLSKRTGDMMLVDAEAAADAIASQIPEAEQAAKSRRLAKHSYLHEKGALGYLRRHRDSFPPAAIATAEKIFSAAERRHVEVSLGGLGKLVAETRDGIVAARLRVRVVRRLVGGQLAIDETLALDMERSQLEIRAQRLQPLIEASKAASKKLQDVIGAFKFATAAVSGPAGGGGGGGGDGADPNSETLLQRRILELQSLGPRAASLEWVRPTKAMWLARREFAAAEVEEALDRSHLNAKVQPAQNGLDQQLELGDRDEHGEHHAGRHCTEGQGRRSAIPAADAAAIISAATDAGRRVIAAEAAFKLLDGRVGQVRDPRGAPASVAIPMAAH